MTRLNYPHRFPRGVCPRCGRDVAVRKDGTVRWHDDPTRAARETCPGSRQPPAPPAPATPDEPPG